MTPPCGPLSRMQNTTPDHKRRDLEAHHNSHHKEVEEAKAMVHWCIKMAERQLSLGKHYFFESSQGSQAWNLEKLKQFQETYNHPTIDVAGCAVGLRDKVSGELFGKKWRIMTSSMAIAYMLEPLVCKGDHRHQLVEGASGGQVCSIQTQVYPPKLVKTVLGGFAVEESYMSWCMPVSQADVQLEGTEINGESRGKLVLASPLKFPLGFGGP